MTDASTPHVAASFREWLLPQRLAYASLLIGVAILFGVAAGWMQWLRGEAPGDSDPLWYRIYLFGPVHARVGLPLSAQLVLWPVIAVAATALVLFVFEGLAFMAFAGRMRKLAPLPQYYLRLLAWTLLAVLPGIVAFVLLVDVLPRFEYALSHYGSELGPRWMSAVNASRFLVKWWWLMLLSAIGLLSIVSTLAGVVSGVRKLF